MPVPKKTTRRRGPDSRKKSNPVSIWAKKNPKATVLIIALAAYLFFFHTGKGNKIWHNMMDAEPDQVTYVQPQVQGNQNSGFTNNQYIPPVANQNNGYNNNTYIPPVNQNTGYQSNNQYTSPQGSGNSQNAGMQLRDLVQFQGTIVRMHRSMVEKAIPNFKPGQPVYWACGEDDGYAKHTGNGWCNGMMNNYPGWECKLEGDFYVVDSKGIMGNIVQIDQGIGIRHGKLGLFAGAPWRYDNTVGTGRDAITGPGFTPEYSGGVAVVAPMYKQ